MNNILRKEIIYRDISTLTPHPLNESLYGSDENEKLTRSISRLGILEPLAILPDRTVISGHERLRSARAAGLEEVPTVTMDLDDDLEIEKALIHFNRQRTKTPEMIGREYKRLRQIIHDQKKKKRGKSREKTKRPVAQAAEDLDISIDTARKYAREADRIESLEKAGKTQQAAKARDHLNNGRWKEGAAKRKQGTDYAANVSKLLLAWRKKAGSWKPAEQFLSDFIDKHMES